MARGTIATITAKQREDLSDMVLFSRAKKTPMLLRLPKGKRMERTLYGYPTKIPLAPRVEVQPDGLAVDLNVEASNASENMGMIYGRMQYVRRAWGTGIIATNATNVLGIGNGAELRSKSKAEAVGALMEDTELSILMVHDSRDQIGTAAGQGMRMRGMGSFISNIAQTDGPTVIDPNFRTPANQVITRGAGGGTMAAAAALVTEDDLGNVLQSMWDNNGGDVSSVDFVTSSVLRRAASDFTRQLTTVAGKTIVRTHQHNKPTEITASITYYESDFGTITFSLHPLLNNSVDTQHVLGYMINYTDDMLTLNYNLPAEHLDLPNLGGGQGGVWQQIHSLQLRNPKAHAKFLKTA